jgi:hypothetical protein
MIGPDYSNYRNIRLARSEPRVTKTYFAAATPRSKQAVKFKSNSKRGRLISPGLSKAASDKIEKFETANLRSDRRMGTIRLR